MIQYICCRGLLETEALKGCAVQYAGRQRKHMEAREPPTEDGLANGAIKSSTLLDLTYYCCYIIYWVHVIL